MKNQIELNYQRAIAEYREKQQAKVFQSALIAPRPFNQSIKASVTLDENYLRANVPSIFSECHNRSARYNMVPTMSIVNTMAGAGYYPVKANQKRKLDTEARAFARHVIRFRHESRLNIQKDDIIPEIVLLNSHDGTSTYKMMLGIFRVVCSNGLIVSTNTMASISVRHTGGQEVLDRIINGARDISARGQQVIDVINTWREKPLLDEQRRDYAAGAFDIYKGNRDIRVYTPALLAPCRQEDKTKDLWTTFNVVQERLLKGGFNTQNAQGHYRRASSVRALDRDIDLNKSLWAYTESFASKLN